MLLEVNGLCVNYGRIEAIRDISFTVEEGEIVTLIGANGAGKTTTMKTVSGLRPVRAGTVVFNGKDITHTPVARAAGPRHLAVARGPRVLRRHDGAWRTSRWAPTRARTARARRSRTTSNASSSSSRA